MVEYVERRLSSKEERVAWAAAAKLRLLRIEVCLLDLHAVLDELSKLLSPHQINIPYRRYPRARIYVDA